MRGFMIFLWCVVTALMFYSAWRFKAPDIENDIRARASQSVSEANGAQIAVDVDGRHVNLRGFANSQPHKDKLLDAADTTYGALGPIDGIVLPQTPASTFLSANYQNNALVLSGVVRSQEDREALLEEASQAGFGAVQDDLIVSDSALDWQSDAELGLAQLSALYAGHLYLTEERKLLSGTAPSPEAADAASSIAGNWTSYVSRPELEDPRIGQLTAALDAKTVAHEALAATLSDRDAQVATLQADAEAQAAQLQDTNAQLVQSRTDLGQLEADKATLQSQVDALKGIAKERAGRIVEMGGQLKDDRAQVSILEAEIAQMSSRLALLNAESGDAVENLQAELKIRQSELEEAQASLNDLRAAKDDQIASLTGDLANGVQARAELQRKLDDLTAQNAELSEMIAEKEQAITTLNQNSGASVETLNAQISSLDAELQAAKDNLAQTGAELNEAQTNLATQAETLTAQAATIDQTQSERDQLAVQVAQLPELEATVSARDARIAELLAAQPKSTPQSLTETCNIAARDLLEDGRINFVTNSAEVEETSIPLLERITGVVLACTGKGSAARVTIAGHTDDRGSDVDNQALSEARAQSIATYFTERGVVASAIDAIGLGETQPIADNNTTEGRAANRRISFDFQAR